MPRASGALPRRQRSALVRSLHDLHGIFDMTPFVSLFHLTLVLASQRILGRMSDGRGAVPFKHLPRNCMDLDLRNHGALLRFPELNQAGSAGLSQRTLRTDELLVCSRERALRPFQFVE
jgi:hypothetical protein